MNHLPEKTSSFSDISVELESRPNFMSPTLSSKLKSNSLQNKNCSLHDLRAYQTNDIIPPSVYPPVCTHFMPYSRYYLHPWEGSSATHSMENLQFSDQLEYDDSDDNLDDREASNRRQSKNRSKKSDMKRSQSTFQMCPIPSMSPVLPPGPGGYFYYYCPSPYGFPVQPSSSPASVRSMSIKNKRSSSLENASSASSSRGQKCSSKFTRNVKPKVPKYVGSGKELSDSGARSQTSSSRQQSEFEEEEDFFSVSNDDSSDDLFNEPNGQWACRYVSFDFIENFMRI
jgi:hypothetical protein